MSGEGEGEGGDRTKVSGGEVEDGDGRVRHGGREWGIEGGGMR